MSARFLIWKTKLWRLVFLQITLTKLWRLVFLSVSIFFSPRVPSLAVVRTTLHI